MDLEDSNHEVIAHTEAQSYAGTDDAASNVNQASTSSTKDDAESSSGKPKKSRVRRRKRELFKNIRDQIAYYFSDSNLRHDKFMRQLTGADAEQSQIEPNDDARNDSEHLMGTTPVPIDSFLKFNKITQLIKQESDLFGAFEYDHQWTAFNIEIIYDPEHRTVCRREPFFNSNSESNAKTIYVERFDVTIDNTFDFLKREFERFGSILSIRTPRFSHSKQLMGFAFIEYAKQSDAERAVQFFEKMTNNVQTNGTETTDINTTASTRKRPLVESEVSTQSETTPDSENVAVKKVKISSDQTTVNCDTECEQIQDHPTIDEDRANADANSSEEVTPKALHSLSEEDSAALLSRMPQVRVMLKQRWTQYKNRYLKLQKSGQSCAFNLPSYDRYLCQTVQESFDLSNAPPLAECILPPTVIVNNGPSQSRRSLKRANLDGSAEKIRANGSVNGGTIVQIDLFTSNAQAIASNRIRKCIRSIFEGQQGPEKTPNVPSLTEIAFIDVSDKMVNFQADGTIEAKCYIRTHQMSAAEMLLGEEFQQQLATSLGWDVSVQRLLILEEAEVNAYWALINQSKKRKNRHQ